jgi:hypothetical protein
MNPPDPAVAVPGRTRITWVASEKMEIPMSLTQRHWRMAIVVGAVVLGGLEGQDRLPIKAPPGFLSPLAVIPGPAAAAAELHVHPRGDDNNPGTSAKPLRTFDGARAAVGKLADKKELVYVHFASGTYYTAPVINKRACPEWH